MRARSPTMIAGTPVLDLDEVLHIQCGVVARHQLLAVGAQPHDIARMVRQRALARIHPGVYVDHTGPPTWRQRAWAACLYHWPAALAGPSALRAVVGPGWRYHDDAGPIYVAIDECRRCAVLPGHRLRRVTGLDDLVLWSGSPPRMKLEEAALDAALARPDEWGRVALLADVCQSRRTTAERILDALETRSRVRDRAWLASVLTDIAAGTCSTLEHGYLTRVERPHGLPSSIRQRHDSSGLGPVRHDVDYAPFPLVVELDGRLFHDTAMQRDRDLDRDLDLATGGRRCVRLGWGQVFSRPCRTAARIGILLAAAGWPGSPRRCGPGCTV